MEEKQENSSTNKKPTDALLAKSNTVKLILPKEVQSEIEAMEKQYTELVNQENK